MGSFAYTCAISGLPIEARDPVRFLLLSEARFNDGFGGPYAVRTFPLRGAYNDYGSVEDYQRGAQQEVWLEAFKYDLIEVGRGDNTVHDVPVSLNMSFEDLLEGLYPFRGRVKVRGVTGLRSMDMMMTEYDKVIADADAALEKLGETPLPRSGRRKRGEPQVDPRLPTIRSVVHAIRDAGLHYHEEDTTKEGFIVDEEGGYTGGGSIRVRVSGYGNGKHEKLLQLQPHLSGFATMITCGSGSYSSNAEMLVRPKPTEDGRLSLHKPLDEGLGRQQLSVELAMVREDVWQACVALGKSIKDDWTAGNDLTGSLYRRIDASNIALSLLQQTPHKPHDELLQVGLETHFNLMWLRAKNGKLAAEEAEDFCKTLEEFSYVSRALALTRYQWRPSSSGGPQFGEWKLHALALESFAKIATDIAEAKDLAEKEDDRRFEEYMRKNGRRLALAKADFFKTAMTKLKSPKYDAALCWLHDFKEEVYRTSPSHTLNGLHWGYPTDLAYDVMGIDRIDGLAAKGFYASFVTPENESDTRFTDNSRYSKVPFSEVKRIVLLGLEQKHKAALEEAEKYPKND